MAREANYQYRELMHARERNAEIAVIGTSHLLRGVRYFNNLPVVLILAGAYTVPPVMYYKLKRAIEKIPSLKILYLEADYHLFFNGQEYQRKNGIPRWAAFFDDQAIQEFGPLYGAPKQGQLYFIQDDVAPILLKRILREAYIAAFHEKDKSSASMLGKNLCDQRTWQENSIQLKDYLQFQEFQWNTWSAEQRESSAINRITTFGLVKGARINNQMMDAYRRTIELAREHHLRVVLVRMPLAEIYRANIPKEVVDQVDAYLQGLVGEFGLQMFDFRSAFDGHGEWFDNQDHLNKEGSLELSIVLRNAYCKEN